MTRASRGGRRTRSAWPTAACRQIRRRPERRSARRARRQHGRRNPLVDRGHDRPAPLAGIRHAPLELGQSSGSSSRASASQIEQPRADHAAAAPQLGDVRHVEIVLVVARDRAAGSSRRRSRAACLPALACLQDIQALGIGGHDPVLDAVVHHLDEVPGAVRSAMQIAVLGRAADLVAPGRARCRPDPGCQRCEDGSRRCDRPVSPPIIWQITALEPPDAAAGADVDVVDALGLQPLGALDVVPVVGVAAVDDDVAGLQQRYQLRPASRRPRPPAPSSRPRAACSACRRSQPSTSRRRALAGQRLHRISADVEDHALWPSRIRRRTMFAPIRPRPIIPSCMVSLLSRCGSLASFPFRRREAGWPGPRGQPCRPRRRSSRARFASVVIKRALFSRSSRPGSAVGCCVWRVGTLACGNRRSIGA